jgi:hypothetical protein
MSAQFSLSIEQASPAPIAQEDTWSFAVFHGDKNVLQMDVEILRSLFQKIGPGLHSSESRRV